MILRIREYRSSPGLIYKTLRRRREEMRATNLLSIVLVQVLFAFGSLTSVAEEQEATQEEDAWRNVDLIESDTLETYLELFPSGGNADYARLFLAMDEKINAIRDGEEEPEFVISEEVLGENWAFRKEINPSCCFIGVSLRSPDIEYHYSDPGGIPTIRHEGVWVLPAGDGSIVALDTNGTECYYLSDIGFQTPGEDPLYFVVIDGVGWVYLHGEGKVILPDGEEVTLGEDEMQTDSQNATS
jgi:hypothetical protein